LCDCVITTGGFKKPGRKRELKVTQKYDTYYEIDEHYPNIEITLLTGERRKVHSVELNFLPWRFEHNVQVMSSYLLDSLDWKESNVWVSFENTKKSELVLSDWIKSIRSPLQVQLYLDILQNQLRNVYYFK
jgi:hypothetical protein